MVKARVLVAMSGGVDSSLAAALLVEAGYEVIGVALRLWSEEGIDDARRVCHTLGIPFYTLNLEPEFQTLVIDYFCGEYARGRTPNPCIACNERIKFELLLRKALALGADYLATGHYATIDRQGRFRLLKALDPDKDQSYVLYSLGQEELSHLLFPLGEYRKAEVRRLAAERSLPTHDKGESQEICFIPNGDYRSFLAQRLSLAPGQIIDLEGKVLGEHQGIALYTIGQRRGLGIASKRPLYVIRIDAAANTLVVGPEEELFAFGLIASRVSFVSGEAPQGDIEVNARIRYRSPAARAVLSTRGEFAELHFHEAQRAITPGQAVVFYRGEEVLGGGIIEGAKQDRSQTKLC